MKVVPLLALECASLCGALASLLVAGVTFAIQDQRGTLLFTVTTKALQRSTPIMAAL